MKKAIIAFALLVAMVMLMGCPSVKFPTAASSGTVGNKTGQSTGSIILGLFGDADASALTAAQNGGITQIATVDTEVKLFIGGIIVYVTTTVTGD